MENEQADEETGRSNPFREPEFSGANGDREKAFFLYRKLNTSRIGNLTPVDLYYDDHTTYMMIRGSRYILAHTPILCTPAHFIPIVGVGKRGEY